MGQGLYKIGLPIEVTYQATKATSGLDDVKMDVYDEAHAIDVAKGVAAMTEIGATGRYYAAFIPDAEGEWQVHIDSASKSGKVIKQFSVTAHNVDSVGDAVAGLNDISSGDVDTALATYDAATGAEVAALNDVSTGDIDARLVAYDAPTKAEMDAKVDALNDVSAADVNAQVDSALADYDAPTKAEMDALQGGDGDTLETLSDQIDNVASADSAPMVG